MPVLPDSPQIEAFGTQIRQMLSLDEGLLHMDVGAAALRSRGTPGASDVVTSTFADIREAVAPGFGCDRDELVITHNTTDAMCKILAGLDLRAGDEIVTTSHEHYAGLAAMALVRDRQGVVIRQVSLPAGNNQRAEDYVELFAAAITHHTKVLLFSAPTYTTGAMLPVRMLASLAQQHNLITVVDAAHVPGMLHCNFHELGVDFLAGSGTKWQYGPAGTGILYVRNKVLPQYNPLPLPTFWPVISIWYPPEGGLPPRSNTNIPSYDIAEYLQTAGSDSLTRLQTFREACEIWDKVGRAGIEKYLLELGLYLKERIAEQWGIDSLYSPKDDARLLTAITAFNPFRRGEDALDSRKFETFVTLMRKEHHIVVRQTEFPVAGARGLHQAIRISTCLFHDREDVDHLVRAMVKVSATME
jgi:selenocysteine lyase/cysteine desulfurase